MSSDQDSVSATEAARELNSSSRSLRRLAEAGKIRSFRTPGGYIRIRRADLDAYKQSLSSSSVPGVPSRVDSGREDVQMLSLELQQRRLRRDLQRLDEEDAEAERKRAEAVAAEQVRSQEALEQARRERAERERREEEEWEKQAEFEYRQQWADSWLEYGLRSLDPNLSPEFVLQIQPAIEESLKTVSPTRPTAIVQQLVLAAIQRIVGPWRRQQEIEKAIKRATQELPLQVRNFSDIFPPTNWEARATAAARDAVSRLVDNVSLVEIQAAAVAAGRKVASEYTAEQDRAREEQQRQGRASSKAFLVSLGVAEIGSHLRSLHLRDEIFDEDLARQVEIETSVRAALEQRLTGSESLLDAQRMARNLVDEEVGA
jgi:excisionase family DNA binding protein